MTLDTIDIDIQKGLTPTTFTISKFGNLIHFTECPLEKNKPH